MSKCHFSLLPIGKKTEGFHPIVRLQSPLGRQLLFCRYIAATGLPLMPSSLAVSFGLNLFYLLSYYCFASTNQPEGNSFKNKNVPNKFSTVPSKKQAFNKYLINECKPLFMLTCANDLRVMLGLWVHKSQT